MSSHIWKPARNHIYLAALAAFAATILFTGEHQLTAETRSKSASFNASVPAQVWSGIKLSNMNEGATLRVSGTTSDRLPVFLFSALTDAEFLPVDDAVLSIISDKEFSFDYQLPEDGDYVLVLDNRDGLEEISYELTAEVSL